jgi:hypothetical protein
MSFTLFEFGTAGDSATIATDRHLIVDASARAGTVSEAIPNPPVSVSRYCFEDEGAMLRSWQGLVAERPAGTLFIATRDYPQIEQPERAGGAMLFVPVQRRPDLDRDAFHAHWHSHGPLILEILPGLLGYVQHHVTPPLYEHEASDYDGVARFWFADLNAVAELPVTHPDQFARIVADEGNFLALPIENYVGHRAES